MNSRSLSTLLVVAVVAAGCRRPADSTPVTYAGVNIAGARAPNDPSAQATAARRIRWGSGVDVMVAPFPDGEHMAETDWNTGDLAVYDLESGQTRRLTKQPSPFADGVPMFPMVSPGGDRIAYTWQDYRESLELQLRVVGTDGSAPTRLYRGPAADWIMAMDWSRDESRVLVLRTVEPAVNQLATISTADGSATVIKTLGGRYPNQVRFSPDGRFVAYDYPVDPESDDRDIYVLTADGGSEAVVVQHPSNDRLLGWAPDGHSLLFVSDRAGTPGAWLVPMADGRASGEPHLVKPDMWNTEPIGFDRKGRYFYAVGVGARAMYEVTPGADGRSLAGDPRDLTSRTHRDVQLPRWSPDGHYLAFVVVRQGRPPGLIIRSVDAGEEREVRLDRRLSYFYDLEWLPDGRSLVAIATDERQGRPLIRINVRTGETVTLLQPAMPRMISGVTVSPDGRTLFYTERHFAETVAEGSERILAYDLESGAQRTVYDGDPARPIRKLVISPDGRALAFDDGIVGKDPTISVLPLNTNRPHAVMDGLAGSLAWTPDGQALLITRPVEDTDPVNSPNRLERVDIATGRATSLGLAQRGLGYLGRLSFDPNGRRAVFVAGVPEYEWWVMEGFLGPSSSPGSVGRNP